MTLFHCVQIIFCRFVSDANELDCCKMVLKRKKSSYICKDTLTPKTWCVCVAVCVSVCVCAHFIILFVSVLKNEE